MLNRIIIMGRLTKEPELRRTQTGKAVTSFTLAVDRDFAKDEVDFIDCVAWGNTAEFVAKYLRKGRAAVVSGRLQMRGWTDKNGNKRISAEVIAENVYFADSKKGEAEEPDDYTPSAPNSSEIADDDELPF